MKVKRLWFEKNRIYIETEDNRILWQSILYYERLKNATPSQREDYEFSAFGIHWDEIDEDVSYDSFEYFFLENKGFKAEKIIYLREYIKKEHPQIGKYIADSVIISLGLERDLKEYLASKMYYGKTRLFYSLKVAVIFLSIIEKFSEY